MKKITLLAAMLLFCIVGYSQTINEAANWPNAGWTISGTYTAGGLLSDPTGAGATLTWSDDDAGNGSADNLQVTSPIINLTAASGAGETWVTVSGDVVYRAFGGDVLAIETYDADTMTWSTLETFTGNSTSGTDYLTCAGTAAYTTAVLDISGFTATQLSGFQYRITYDDQGGWQWGWCLTSPTITSALPPSCFAPSDLTATNATATAADLSWTENGSATAWDIEIVPAATAATGTPTATAVSNPYTATGLSASTEYDYYVRADCATDGTSNWAGPFTFATACGIINTAYTNEFTTFLGNCWEEGDNTDIATGPNGTNGAWTTDGFLNNGTSGAARINLYTTFANDWLVSPTFDLSAGNLGLAFDVGVTTFSGTTAIAMGSDDEVQVLISNDDGATWNTLETFNAGNTPSNTGDAKLYDLSGYTSATTKFAFWASEGTVDDPEDYNFFIDNFSVDVYASLGIDDLQQIEGFVMYPNPVNDVLNISAKNTIENLQIINMLGQVVKTSSPNKNSFQLNISNLNTGIYFVKVSVNNTEATIRIVKN
jgi:hypothetical protein